MTEPYIILSSWLSLCQKLLVGGNLMNLWQKQFWLFFRHGVYTGRSKKYASLLLSTKMLKCLKYKLFLRTHRSYYYCPWKWRQYCLWIIAVFSLLSW